MKVCDYILFYGTLRTGGVRGRVRTGISYVKKCVLRGRMYNVGAFPALVHGGNEITCELYQITDQNCMERFDAIEGYRHEGSKNNLYNRESVTVEVNGEEVEAWIYYWNGGVNNMEEIDCGDWLEYTGGD